MRSFSINHFEQQVNWVFNGSKVKVYELLKTANLLRFFLLHTSERLFNAGTLRRLNAHRTMTDSKVTLESRLYRTVVIVYLSLHKPSVRCALCSSHSKKHSIIHLNLPVTFTKV